MRPQPTAALSLLIAVAAACNVEVTGTAGAPSREVRAGDIELSVSASPRTFAAGDTTWIDVALRNTSGREITLHFGSGCQLLYEVEDSRGQRVQPEGGGFGCIDMLTKLRLASGERAVRRFPWTARRFDYPPPTYTPIEPGTYRIRGVLMTSPEIRSAPVAVTVTKPQ